MSVCVIARDQNKEIQEVYAPNEQPSTLFRSVVKALGDNSKEGKEKALKVWARAYTPTFKRKFGDWELLSQAKKHLSGVKGFYKEIIESKTQQALFEASVQANSSPSERKGAIMAFGEDLVNIAQKLFPDVKVGDNYKPVVTVATDVNGEPLVHTVLNTREKAASYDNNPVPSFNEQTPQALAQRLSMKMGIPFEFDENLPTLGAVKNGKVIINPKTLATDTVLHEFTHPFVEAIRLTNPSLFKNLSSRASSFTYNGQSIEDFVKENNPDLDVNSVEFKAEVITTAIGLEGTTPGSVTDVKKVADWLKTIFRKIAEYINSLVIDPSQHIKPEQLNMNMTIKDLAELMRVENKIDLDILKNRQFSANQTTSANQDWGSNKTIDFFEKQQNEIKLEEQGDDSFYTKAGKKFQRLTEYAHETFYSSTRTNTDKWLDRLTTEEFARQKAALTDKINYKDSTEPLSYDEVKAKIKLSYEVSRIKGKIMHKMIEGYLKHNNSLYFSDDLEKLRQEGQIEDHELLWFDESRIKEMLNKIGINSADFGNTDVKFRDNVASELMMVSDVLGIGTSNDGFIEHSDGSISFMDYKTGSKFLADENTIRKMKYANGLESPVYDSKLDRAKIELVMRMILAKMNKPDLQVRELKVAFLSRYFGTQIRTVNVQQFLDYINNNMRLSIQELEKEAKKDPSLKDTLEEKKKQYQAMKDARVFDFYNYKSENKVFEQDTDLQDVTDPQEKMKILKERVASKTRQSFIKEGNVIVPEILKEIKQSLFAVLNAHKSANISDVKTDTKDISWFASKVMGLREQTNAFLQSISHMFEEATDRANRKINELVGEQSAFRKADRALHKEYKERVGGLTTAIKTFSYSDGNTKVPLNEQGIFDFMYTWKNVAGENQRIGAVYTEEDFKNGTLTEAQWNYYKESKKVIKEVYEAVRNKTAYIDKFGKKVTYGQEYGKNDGFKFDEFQESFLPTIPFQTGSEILEKNIQTKQLNPVNITKEWFENYKDKYDLAIQNENKFNIGMPLKYMSQDFLGNDDHSFNVSAGVDIFARHMVNKFELDDVYDIGMSTVAAMTDTSDPEMRNIKGKLHLENSAFLLESFLKQNILGQRRKTLSYWGEKNVVANKRTDLVIDNIGGFISKNAFWFAPVTAFFNGLYGLITNGRESLIGSLSKRLFGEENAVTMSHIAKAAAISAGHQATHLATQGNLKRQFSEDWDGNYYKDKVNFMMKTFRLSNKNYQYADTSLMLGVHNRIMSGDNAYVAQGIGEDLSNETLMIATLLAQKVAVKSVDASGKEVTKYLKTDGTYTTDVNDPKIENMWDAYKYNEDSKEYEYTGPVRFKDKDGNDVKGLTTLETIRTKTYLERMYGAYSPEQRTHLERYGLGRMAMKFRKFWITNIRENFTMKGHNKYVGEYTQMFNADNTPKLKDGQPMYEWKSQMVRARVLVMASLLGSFAGVKGTTSWNDMSIEDKKQFVRICFELAFLGLAVAMGMGAVFPPEDKDKLYAKRLSRLTEDLASIHLLDLIRGTTTIDSYPTQLYKAANATSTFFHSLATDDIVESGPYKGDYKGWNTVEDFIPVYHAANQTTKLIDGQ